MDKYEYKLKTEEMLKLMDDGAYTKAAEIADMIDWKRVRNTAMLMNVSDIFEKVENYQKSYDALKLAYRRAEGSRKIISRLCILAIKSGQLEEAINYYDDFVQEAPKDPNQYILKYQILRARKAPVEQQIEALEEYKKSEYIEEWAYELAKLYQEAGMTEECIEECDDLILWFSEGKYVYKAMELKMQYKPLTPSQQKKYDNRFSNPDLETEETINSEVITEQSSEKGEERENMTEEPGNQDSQLSFNEEPGKKKDSEEQSDIKRIGDTMPLDEALKKLFHPEQEENISADADKDVLTAENIPEPKLEDLEQEIDEIEAVADATIISQTSDKKKRKPASSAGDMTEITLDDIEEDPDEILDDWEGKPPVDPVSIELTEEEIAESIDAVKEIVDTQDGEKILSTEESDAVDGSVSTADTKEIKESDAPDEIVDADTIEGIFDESDREDFLDLQDLISIADAEDIIDADVIEEETVDASEAEDIVEEAEPIETVDVSEAEDIAEEAEPIETVDASEAEDIAEEAEPIETVDVSEAEDIAEEAEPTETVDVSEAEEAEPIETVDASEAEDIAEEAEPIETVDASEAEDIAEEAEPIETVDVSEAEDIAEEAEPIETVDASEAEDIAEEAEPTETVDVSEAEDIVEEAEPIETVDASEAEDIVEEAEPIETVDVSEADYIEGRKDNADSVEAEIKSDASKTEINKTEGEQTGDIMDTKNKTTPILPPDIQRLIDEIEGVIPPEEEKETEPVQAEVPRKRRERRRRPRRRENIKKVVEKFKSEDEEIEDNTVIEESDFSVPDETPSFDDNLFSDHFDAGDHIADDDYLKEREQEENVWEDESIDGEEYFGDAEDLDEEEYLGSRDDLFSAEDVIDEEESIGISGTEEFKPARSFDDDFDNIGEAPDLEEEFKINPEHASEPDDREIPDDDDSMDILSATTPLSRKETAKLIATGKTSPLPLEEISDVLSMSDTGFLVHGRYSFDTQDGSAPKGTLTDEQKKLFSYFVPVRGMSEQLVDVLEQDKNCTNRKGTSRTGNLLIIGNKGNGKTVLAVDVVKAIQKQRNIRQGKVAIVTGESLNKKKISDIVDKLYGGALIIEKAGTMNEKTVARLNKAMEKNTGEMLIVLEEQRKPLDRLLSSNREFRRKFTSRLEVPVFINDELVTFGQTYAQENGYRIDEMGILALYSRIDSLQREDHAVTVAEVKEIMDEAIQHSQKASAKKLVKRVFGKNTDDADRIILSERDFNI